VEACGLCGTDHEQFTGALPSPGPFVPGHETIGVIVRAGAGATRRWGVHEGDRVAVAPFQACRACPPCQRGDYRRCRNHGLRTAYGFVPTSAPPSLWGGYAGHQYLAPDSILLPVPEGLDPILATAFNPLGAGIAWGAELAPVRSGDVVAVLGPGIRGLSSAVAAKSAGAGFVMVTGFGDRDRPRLELARAFGADLAVDVSAEDPVDRLREAAGRLADVVVDVTAKAPAALAQAISLARSGGTIVVAGTRGSTDTPGFWPDLIVFKELRIQGALGVDVEPYRRALDLLNAGTFPFADLPRRVEPLERAGELLTTMAGESGGPPPVHAVLRPLPPPGP
jgi:alcohol dehydrogenase